MNFYEFAVKSPFTMFIIVCAVYYTIKNLIDYFKRRVRSKDIQRHGWPKNPHMDADGDIVYPKEEDEN